MTIKCLGAITSLCNNCSSCNHTTKEYLECPYYLERIEYGKNREDLQISEEDINLWVTRTMEERDMEE